MSEYPNSIDAEQCVLSALMQWPGEAFDEAAECGVTEDHFFTPQSVTLWRLLHEMHGAGDPIDRITVGQALEDAGELETVGGHCEVGKLFTLEPLPGKIELRAKVLREKLTRRKAVDAAEKLKAAAMAEGDHMEGLKNAQAEVAGIRADGRSRCLDLVRADAIEPQLDSHDFFEGLLTDGGASVIYGSSNVGKSFWALDVAAHVATGCSWRFDEHEVEPGAVIYVALEGQAGIRNRVEAMRRRGELSVDDAPLYFVFTGINLLSVEDPTLLVNSVSSVASSAGQPVKLVVIDTLSRAMPGGNENTSESMTAAVEAIDRIRKETGSHVALVHHCGKDEARGARGHSSLRAAVDTEIELVRPSDELVTTARVTKQRDLNPVEPMPFQLDAVELGTNRRGKPVTSCVVKQLDGCMAAEPGHKGGRKPSVTDDELLSLLPMAGTVEWQRKAHEELGIGRSAFYDRKRNMNGRIVEADGQLRKA